jgi:uncharacterized protein YciI
LIYAFHLLDRPGGLELRLKVRPEHKAYLSAVADRLAFAGPLTTEDGQTMIGSLLAIEFESLDAARDWAANEPFTKAGLYSSISILPFVNLWPQKTGFPPVA